MDGLQITILALLQGLTEFLPISSSAHLILAPRLFGYDDQGLAFDVAVHIGSLLAVITYFRHELVTMRQDFFGSFGANGRKTEHSRLAWMIILSTLPILLFGKLAVSLVQNDLRSTSVIATTTILFGLLLYWADRRGRQTRDEWSIRWKDALIIGLFQALAIIPGVSRSGITMTAGMMLGMTREATSRFSFLLSIPTIIMSGILVTMELLDSPVAPDWSSMALGILLAFLSSWLCIHVFLRLIERIRMTPFVIYRLLLGLLLIGIIIADHGQV